MTQTDQKNLVLQKASKVMSKLYSSDDVTNNFDENFVQLYTSKQNEF